MRSLALLFSMIIQVNSALDNVYLSNDRYLLLLSCEPIFPEQQFDISRVTGSFFDILDVDFNPIPLLGHVGDCGTTTPFTLHLGETLQETPTRRSDFWVMYGQQNGSVIAHPIKLIEAFTGTTSYLLDHILFDLQPNFNLIHFINERARRKNDLLLQ
jgi:hypothetical protein